MSLQVGDHTLHASRPVPIAVIVVTSPMAKSPTTSGFLATSTRNIRDPCLTRNSRPTHAKSVTRIHKRLAFLVHTNALTSTSCKRTILLPWVSTKGIAGLRMKGLQRTCASARYTRLIVLPRFLCVWLRNSRAPFPLKPMQNPRSHKICLCAARSVSAPARTETEKTERAEPALLSFS